MLRYLNKDHYEFLTRTSTATQPFDRPGWVTTVVGKVQFCRVLKSYLLTLLTSIPKRRELVKEAARNPTSAELKETRKEQQGHLWSVDPLSQKPLAQPVVSDALGRLFNKDSVIEFLLPSEDGDSGRRIEQEELVAGAFKSLKDVVEVKFEVETAEDGRKSKDHTRRTEKWICPVTRQELGPGSKAVYLVPCGHAFSGSAVKEISGELCLQVSDT